MEGYLFKKGRGDSSFGRRNWKKRWFILEESELRYYDSLDPSSNEPVGLRDKIDVTGCQILPVTHHEKKFTFVLKFPLDSHSGDILLQAPDNKAMNQWIKELTAAANNESQRHAINYAELYELLGLNEEDNPSASDISRAYRRAALKAHPDKGGNMAQFKEIQTAYQQITARLEKEENDKLYDSFLYTAVLVKGAGDAGLGLLVTEDPLQKIISIKDILPSIQLLEVQPAKVGSLRAGDVLVAVRNEDVTRMPLSRVAQKLNEARVPVNTAVKLTFRRRYLKDGSDNYGYPEEEEPESTEDNDPQSQSDLSPGNSERMRSSPRSSVGETFVPEAQSPVAVRQSPQTIPVSTPAPVVIPAPAIIPAPANIPAPSPVVIPVPATPSPMRQPSARAVESYQDEEPPRNYTSHLDPVTYIAVMSENDELKAELAEKLKELEQSKAQNDKLREDFLKLQSDARDMGAQKIRLETHLQHAYLLSKMSREQMASSMNQMLTVSKKVLSNAPLDINPSMQNLLAKEQLTEEHIKDNPVKGAQRSAIIGTMSMDSLGHTVQKWSQEGDSAVKKLERFEEKLRSLGTRSITRPPNQISQSRPLSSTGRAPLSTSVQMSPTNSSSQPYQFQPTLSSNVTVASVDSLSQSTQGIPRPYIPSYNTMKFSSPRAAPAPFHRSQSVR